MSSYSKTVFFIVIMSLLVFIAAGCGNMGGWWSGDGNGPADQGQGPAAPGAGAGPAVAPAGEAADGQGPVPVAEDDGEAAMDDGADVVPGAGQEPFPVAEDGMGPAVDDAGPAGEPGPAEQPPAAQQDLPELQVIGFVFFPQGSDQPVGRVPVNTAGQLRVKVMNAGNVDARNVECYVQLENGPKDFFVFENIPAHRDAIANRPFKLNVPAGERLVKCSINEGMAVLEADSADDRNNIVLDTIEVTPAGQPAQENLPELQAAGLTFFPDGTEPRSPAVRVPVNTKGWIMGWVRNAGALDAENVSVYFQVDNENKREINLQMVTANTIIGCGIPVVFDKVGWHGIQFRVNPDNAVVESDRADDRNNELKQKMEVLAAEPALEQSGLPELQITSVSFLPFGLRSSDPVARVTVNTRGFINAIIRNAGNVPALGVKGYIQVDNGAKNEFVLVSAPAHFDSRQTQMFYFDKIGWHSMKCCINTDNAVREFDGANDRNNELTQMIEVVPAITEPSAADLAELQVRDVFVSSESQGEPMEVVSAGAAVWMNARIKNAGSAPAESVEGYFMVDKKPPLFFDLGRIPAGSEKPCGGEVLFDELGRHSILFCVNPNHTVRESDSADDRNNEFKKIIDVTGPIQSAQHELKGSPCLVAEDIAFCPTPEREPVSLAYVGESGALTFTVSNKTGPVDDVNAHITMTLDNEIKFSSRMKFKIPASGVFIGTTSDTKLTLPGKYLMTVVAECPANTQEVRKQGPANECTRTLEVRRRVRRKPASADNYSAGAMYNTLVGGFMRTSTSSGQATAPAQAASTPSPSTPSTGYQTTPPPAAKTTIPSKTTAATYRPGTVKLNK